VGDIEVELIEPVDANSGVAKFVERWGEGLHHIYLEVDDVDAELDSLAAKGVELIHKNGRNGVVAPRIAFLHRHSISGVLVELAQKEEN